MLEDAEKTLVMEDGKIMHSGSYNEINKISERQETEPYEDELESEINESDSSVKITDIAIKTTEINLVKNLDE